MMSLPRRIRTLTGLAVAATAAISCQTSHAANFLWNAATPGANNWSDSFNWNPTGIPGIGDTAIFGAIGTGSDSVTPNNIVNVSTSVANLSYTNTTSGAWHVTQISAPNKLTVTNNFTVGGLNADGLFTSVAMIGNGTLELDGNNFKVGNAGSANAALNSTLDMSGLSNFVYKAQNGTWIIGGSAGDARAAGTLTLAGLSNNVTVNTLYVNVGSGNNSSVTTLFQFGGGTNILNVGTFMLCSNKAQFATAQFLDTAPASAGLRIRGTNGNADDASRGNIIIGERNNTGGANTVGNMLLNGHPVDIKANLLLIGDDRSGSSGTSQHGGVGQLQFDTGIVDATSIILGQCTSGNSLSIATGTLNVGANGTLIAGSGGITLGRRTSGTAGGGSLIISGTAFSSNSIVKGTTTSTNAIDLSFGKLTMTSGVIGTPDASIDNFTLASSTLTLPVVDDTTNIVAANFNPADGGSVINISSLPILTGYPSQFPVIYYSSLVGGGSVSLGTLPGTFKGYITNDTSVNTVFLVVTNGPATSKTDLWKGNVNSTWDTSTLNWTSSSVPAAYTENDTVTFDDSAVRTNITYSTTHTPLDMEFNNFSLPYILSGTGKISGPASLTLNGSGSVTLSANGDDFSGGINVNAGTLILDGANSAITGQAAIAGGATLQIGNNDSNGNVPSSITNNGTVIFNRANGIGVNSSITGFGGLTKLGNGTLTLSNANTYSSDTTVSQGTLALAGAGALPNSPNINVTGATLDVSGVASGSTTLNNLSLANAVLTLGSSNGVIPLNASFVNLGGSGNTINITALPGMATYPSTITLVKTVSGISGNAVTLGSLPAATPPYAGSVSVSGDSMSIQLTLTSGPLGTRPSVLWTGADLPNLNTNWSDAQNWQTPGAPTAGDNVVFTGTSVVFDNQTIDNVVDTTTTISTLRYTNATSGQWHVTEIPSGVTLTVSSNLTVGGLTGDSLNTLAAFTGGGSLLVNGASLSIGNLGSSSVSPGTLDLSALSNFVYSVPTGTISMGNGNRSAGTFKLANGSNYIAAATLNDNVGSSSSSTGNLSLGGGTNILNVGAFNIAAGRLSSTVSFPDVTGGVRIRGVAGTDSSRAAITIGNRNNGGGSGNSITGNLSLNGHPVDMKLSTLTLGESGSNPTGTANGNGNFSFDTGTVDVNGIVLAVANGTTAGVQASGIINVGSDGTLIVGSAGVNMGNRTGASGTNNAVLNIGGIATVSGNIFKSTVSSTATITVTNGGVLKMLSGTIGTPAVPIDYLNLDTATLQLNITSASVTNIVATNVVAANTTTINIGSVSGVTAPATVSLMSYASGTTDPFPNLVLGTLPSGVTATLVDNQANSTIDLNITAVPVTVPPTIGNITISGGNIIISGTNNVGTGGGTYHVLSSTNLSLPLANWTVVTNGTFNDNGTFNTTNAVDPTKPRGFYLLQVP